MEVTTAILRRRAENKELAAAAEVEAAASYQLYQAANAAAVAAGARVCSVAGCERPARTHTGICLAHDLL